MSSSLFKYHLGSLEALVALGASTVSVPPHDKSASRGWLMALTACLTRDRAFGEGEATESFCRPAGATDTLY